ncbi:MAG TPA: 2-hydroxyacid dehydrogenase [Flavisolibacter sp.]|jgi:D-lactate dehydrogenase|nr:2-hydroxyacid dehydrogenase [Flavisolibacter sp.]
MKIAFFSSQPYDKQFFTAHNDAHDFSLQFFDVALSQQTVGLAKNADAVCVFVNDKVDAEVISQLKQAGVKIIALRCAGFNNVDLAAAREAGLHVCRVPAYSPEAVAEHAAALILALNRKIHKAYNRVREQNFALQGLIGFDLFGKTVGVVGTGKIGQAFCRIMRGFGCRVLAFDVVANKEMEAIGVTYLPLLAIFQQADIISLHTPLNDQTLHMINSTTVPFLKQGVMLINTSRGALIDTPAVIDALKSGQIGSLGIDVYEQEEHLFFHDRSGDIIEDDTIQRLMSFPNVLVTAHQAFFTKEALDQIAETTFFHLTKLEEGVTEGLPGLLV